MSTRQRASLDTADPLVGARLLLARASDDATALPVDIGALRLRALSARFAGTDVPFGDDNADGSLNDTDTEFEPVSLAAILALGREQSPDAAGDSLLVASDAAAAAPLISLETKPAAPGHDAVAVSKALPPVPAPLSDDAAPVPVVVAEAVEHPSIPVALDEPEIESEVSIVAEPGADQPLMLSDQSETDLRLVDLIRRQQTLLEQLNRFPPPYDTPESPADPKQAELPAQALSVVDQLARSATEPAPSVLEIGRDTPPPLPSHERMALPPPAAKQAPARERNELAARDRKEEPPEPVLTEQSPMIIQRARAEQIGRRVGHVVAAPPSALPAFLGGLAAAVVIAGVLLAVL